MVLDAAREWEHNHREILEKELALVGLRLNQSPPNISFRLKKTGGLKFNATLPLTKLGDDPKKTVYSILHEYKIHNAEVLFREDATVDQLIDVIEGNRKYVRCLYVYNKIDQVTMEDIDELARRKDSTVISCNMHLNTDRLLAHMWRMLGLTRVFTKRKGAPPDFDDPVVLTSARRGVTVRSACMHIHRTLVDEFHYALVWGRSAKHTPQHCGLAHRLADQDVLQIVKKTVRQQRVSKGYGDRVQAYFDEKKRKKKKKKKKTPG
eukprot:PLAT12575.1.p2 GENE.PLAT12575.1~~PLAT12575.1.p2  ORF type:complete len:264 (+),score=155.64 PLAT12575.1:518-1309(+)